MTYRFVVMVEVSEGNRELFEVPRRLRPLLEELDRLGARAAGTVLQVSRRKGDDSGVVEVEITGYKAGVASVEIMALVSQLGLPPLLANPEESQTADELIGERSAILDDLLSD